jgi:predicted phosphodiesterase
MPTIALLSDIHANVHALKPVLREIETLGIDQIVFCGDIVGYGPHPAECVKLVREAGGISIMGNHDYYTVAASTDPEIIPAGPDGLTNPVWAGIRHAVKHLDPEAIDWLASLPRFAEIPGAIVAHAALHDTHRWPYLLSSHDARPTLEILERCKFGIAFFGHTHRQEWFSLPGKPDPEPVTPDKFQLMDGSVCAVVVGSVGQPRTGDTRAAWTLWDSEQRTFEFRQTVYPFKQTAKDIHEAGLPASSARRLLGAP